MSQRKREAAPLGGKQYEEAQKIVAALQSLQDRAHKAGLTMIAHGINNAINCAGWAMAGDIELAGLAARGERPKAGADHD